MALDLPATHLIGSDSIVVQATQLRKRLSCRMQRFNRLSGSTGTGSEEPDEVETHVSVCDSQRVGGVSLKFC